MTTFERNIETGDIRLQMTSRDWELLLLMMGYAIGSAMRDSNSLFQSFIYLTNRLNEQNPNFTPYHTSEAK